MRHLLYVTAALTIPWTTAIAQDSEAPAASATPDAQPLASEDGLLSEAALQQLVAPVALYPDTLLIQILVASTYPLEVMKADRFLKDNAGTEAEALTPDIAAQGWDDSVEVLATAFPDVIAEMAVHVDWTDTMGSAMLAQDEDVMTAIQVMRQSAQDSGALTSTPEQTVEVAQSAGTETIIIEPANPEVVYVPQYDPEVVYVRDDSGSDVGDALAAGLITFTTVALIAEIFDDDDDWYGYWGCRYCGGWNGRPIISHPRDFDVDINRDFDIGDITIGNEIGNRGDIGWTPDPDRQNAARDKIGTRLGDSDGSGLQVNRPERGDELRDRLSDRTGAADISGSGGLGAGAAIGAGALAATGITRPGSLSPEDRKAALDRTKAARPEVQRPAAANRPAAKPAARPKAAKNVSRPKVKAAAKRKPSGNHHAMAKRASPSKARAGAARARAHAGGRR